LSLPISTGGSRTSRQPLTQEQQGVHNNAALPRPPEGDAQLTGAVSTIAGHEDAPTFPSLRSGRRGESLVAVREHQWMSEGWRPNTLQWRSMKPKWS